MASSGLQSCGIVLIRKLFHFQKNLTCLSWKSDADSLDRTQINLIMTIIRFASPFPLKFNMFDDLRMLQTKHDYQRSRRRPPVP